MLKKVSVDPNYNDIEPIVTPNWSGPTEMTSYTNSEIQAALAQPAIQQPAGLKV
eukprot:CAMPEP_0113699576 /NCGR_PEP_ID=MMETSP0038_2-20120614/23412_1 /TAXON_ID=2898 /ORGANISM="Cryptomonas paramecium" /LENGTH=53 /DNA_ID=CAMNT_0000623005 /DNA_START=75 /DNA_END=236 /DNA_ORIENTATION=+ /assembly_acc=CAM_ASM_000170